MKRIHSAIFSALVLPGVAALLAGCGSKVLDFRNAEISNGKVYANGANTPFSGKVTNVPGGTVFGPQPGYAKLISTLSNVSPDLSIADVGLTALCDAESSDGVLDGKVLCKERNSDAVTIESQFSSGRLDGSFTVHDQTGAHTLAQLSFKDGQLDGKMQIYSAKSGKLIHVATWEAGVLNGEESGYDPDTGNLILHATLVNGTYDGEVTRFAADGKTLLYKGTYVHGKEDGEVTQFDPKTGIREVDHFADGKLNGSAQAWDASGKSLGEKNYVNGVDVAEQQNADEKAELANEINLALNDPDPKVAACVRAIVDHSGMAMNDSQQSDYDRKLLARHVECKANPDALPAASDQSLKIMPPTSDSNNASHS
ncbi:toxin-antitoxin system YwqK family antitoxin [Trinickia sp.]|uniref:toxin-antitoxin system YwqK family antitoxin n=1 Tax=Trinickia sp. TaxID=2571163 RepID=UPI003F7CD416